MNYLQKQAMLNKIAQTKLAIRFAYRNNFMKKKADRPMFGPSFPQPPRPPKRVPSQKVHPGQWRPGEERFRVAHPGPGEDPYDWYYNIDDDAKREAYQKYMPPSGLKPNRTPITLMDEAMGMTEMKEHPTFQSYIRKINNQKTPLRTSTAYPQQQERPQHDFLLQGYRRQKPWQIDDARDFYGTLPGDSDNFYY